MNHQPPSPTAKIHNCSKINVLSSKIPHLLTNIFWLINCYAHMLTQINQRSLTVRYVLLLILLYFFFFKLNLNDLMRSWLDGCLKNTVLTNYYFLYEWIGIFYICIKKPKGMKKKIKFYFLSKNLTDKLDFFLLMRWKQCVLVQCIFKMNYWMNVMFLECRKSY